jgi:hypothetical protein
MGSKALQPACSTRHHPCEERRQGGGGKGELQLLTFLMHWLGVQRGCAGRQPCATPTPGLGGMAGGRGEGRVSLSAGGDILPLGRLAAN